MWLDTDICKDISKYFLYYDTIYIPDPVPNYLSTWDTLPCKDKLTLFDWLCIVMELKELITSDFEIPLIIIYPQQYSSDNRTDIVKNLQEVADRLTINSVSNILHIDKSINNLKELFSDIETNNYFKTKKCNIDYNKLDSLTQLVEITNGKCVQFNNGASKKYNYSDYQKRKYKHAYENEDIIWITSLISAYFYLILSREHNSSNLKASNTTSQNLFSGYEFRNKIIRDNYLVSDISDEEIIDYSFETGFSWLNNLSVQDCIKIREFGFMEDMRDLFKIKNKNIAELSIKDFNMGAKAYEEDVKKIIFEENLRLHKDFSDIKKKLALSSASLAIGTSLTIGGFIYPPAAIISATLGIALGTKSVKDVFQQSKEFYDFKSSFSYRPANLLVSHSK